MGAGHESVSGAKVCESITEDTDSRRLLSTSSQGQQEQPGTRASIQQVGLTAETPMLVSTQETKQKGGCRMRADCDDIECSLVD